MAFYRDEDDAAAATWTATKDGLVAVISKWADGSHLLELSTGRIIYWDAESGETCIWEHAAAADPAIVHGITSFEQLAQRYLQVQ